MTGRGSREIGYLSGHPLQRKSGFNELARAPIQFSDADHGNLTKNFVHAGHFTLLEHTLTGSN